MPEQLNELRAAPFSKALETAQNGSFQYYTAIADFVLQRARLEREHAKKLAELTITFQTKTNELKKTTPLPSMCSAVAAMVSETSAASKTYETLGTQMDAVGKSISSFLENSKTTAKRLSDDRLAEESALRGWDKDLNSYATKAADTTKLAALEPQERATIRNMVFSMSAEEAKHEKQRAVAASKIAHNDYYMRHEANNISRDYFLDEELVTIMNQTENMVFKFSEEGVASRLVEYQRLLATAAASIVEQLETLRTGGIELINVDSDTAALADAVGKTKPDAIPFTKPPPRKFMDPGYGYSLVLDEHTLFTLSAFRRSFDQQLAQSQKQQEKLTTEREGLEKMVDAYTQNPAMGSAQSLHLKVLENEKCQRMLRLKIKRFEAMIGVLTQNNIDGKFEASHKFSKPSMFKSAELCIYCGDRAGGVRQAVGAVALCCSTCKAFAHEGRCATYIWRGCKNDDVFGLLKSIKPDAVPLSEQKPAKPASAVLANKPSVTSKAPVATATVLYDYVSQREDELSISEVGATVEVADGQSGEWIKVRYNGQEGLYPAAYLDFAAVSLPQDIHMPEAEAPPPEPETEQITQDSSQDNAFIKRVRAIYDYDAQESDQLTIKEGDILSVISEDDDGWSRGVLDGKEGLFPSAYCEEE